jgi:hypothetical protein
MDKLSNYSSFYLKTLGNLCSWVLAALFCGLFITIAYIYESYAKIRGKIG